MRRTGLICFLIGGGGREHAIERSLIESPRIKDVYVAPGNAGIMDARRIQLDVNDIDAIIAAAKNIRADFIICGPEAPLTKGLKDHAEAEGIPVYGSSQAASQLEADKIFAKEVMSAAGISKYTGQYFVAMDLAEAEAFIDEGTAMWGRIPVIKAFGLTGGKGVTVPVNRKAAYQAARDALVDKVFGDQGERILIEERFVGREVSFHFICDGEDARSFLPSRDRKALSSEPGAPNTGGMGAYAPLPDVDDALVELVRTEIVLPVLAEMKRRGTPFTGTLYVGAMVTEDGVKVLEFNCRLGDPETQVLLALLKSDLADYVLASLVPGGLENLPNPVFKQNTFAVCTTAVARGYPGKAQTGDVIALNDAWNDERSGMYLLHAGTTRLPNGDLITAGGRVMNSIGLAPTLDQAEALSAANLESVRFEGKYSRRDIVPKG